MKTHKLKALFPITAMVTQEIIDDSNINDVRNCIGTNTLRSVLPKKYAKDITWGAYQGFVYEGTPHAVNIHTAPQLDMMGIFTPIEVTFILK